MHNADEMSDEKEKERCTLKIMYSYYRIDIRRLLAELPRCRLNSEGAPEACGYWAATTNVAFHRPLC
jgi:hypothetical protein